MSHRFLFILNNFNDVDQTAPLLFDLLERDHSVTVLCLGRFNLRADPRIAVLLNRKQFKVSTLLFLNLVVGSQSIFSKLVSALVFNITVCRFYLKRLNISMCVYTWCNPYHKGVQTRLFKAAQSINIPNTCIPHGHNIFLNYDVNEFLTKYYKNNHKWPSFSARNQFNLYVVQTEHHRNGNIEWGLDPNTVRAWGSMRFTPSWVATHANFFPEYDGPKVKTNSVVNIVFFIPHWHYNVDTESTVHLINELATIQYVVLAVKGHTRGDNLCKSNQDYAKLNNIDVNTPAASSTLIKWCDIVINFGSSIGLEAIASGKPMINPSFLHRNKTVFDNNSAVLTANNISEVLDIVKDYPTITSKVPDLDGRDKLLMTEVYANNIHISPVDRYRVELLKLLD